MGLLNYFRTLSSQAIIWPSIEYELTEAKKLNILKGNVLNAGAGTRDISHLIEGDLINQDIAWESENRKNIDIYSPIHQIPRPDCFFDCILCIAVLEHVINPQEVVAEFFRVLAPNGYVVASVPFLQPEHKIPTDYQRYTRDGLETLFRNSGFEIVSIKPLFTVFHTIHWIVYEWLHTQNTLPYKALRVLLLPLLVYMATHSKLQSEKLASVFQIIARKQF